MNSLSEQAKQELFNALEGKESGVFVINGRLVSVEVEGVTNIEENYSKNVLSQEIEENPELKASLTRFINNPDMKRYTKNELKAKRHERRK